MDKLSFAQRVTILVGLFIAAVGGVLFVDPIPQDPAYHLFADSQSYLGLPNFGNVTSNVGFAVVGLLGLMTVLGRRGRGIFESPLDAWPYIVFFLGVGVVGAGSAYYHAVPDNERLVWDRLPMTVAFMSLFAAFIADRIHGRAGVVYLLPGLIVVGLLSLFYWEWTEAQGRGDLRFYVLVQLYPMIALPMMCWLFRQSRYTDGKYLAWVIGLYAAAKVLEVFDAGVFDLLANAISGHSLKHLLSAVATYMILRMLVQSKTRSP
ncbi:MAG: ceramidase domain-containing protein [Planctomycetota bacterium]|nr:ceramidase domain-containing protein [Planctomycetota bacterium]